MMVVSRSAMIPETALAAVIQACVPLFPACSADRTKDTWNKSKVALVMQRGHSNKLFSEMHRILSVCHAHFQ